MTQIVQKLFQEQYLALLIQTQFRVHYHHFKDTYNVRQIKSTSTILMKIVKLTYLIYFMTTGILQLITLVSIPITVNQIQTAMMKMVILENLTVAVMAESFTLSQMQTLSSMTHLSTKTKRLQSNLRTLLCHKRIMNKKKLVRLK